MEFIQSCIDKVVKGGAQLANVETRRGGMDTHRKGERQGVNRAAVGVVEGKRVRILPCSLPCN